MAKSNSSTKAQLREPPWSWMLLPLASAYAKARYGAHLVDPAKDQILSSLVRDGYLIRHSLIERKAWRLSGWGSSGQPRFLSNVKSFTVVFWDCIGM